MTDNAANYVVVDRLLEKEFRGLFLRRDFNEIEFLMIFFLN